MSNIAFAPLARPTFDVPLAQEVTETAIRHLEAPGCTCSCPAALLADRAGVDLPGNADRRAD